ncbi:MAG: PQQ-dependent sugar dehydrogenase [Prosthecobacter sp.]|uniref:PQQ-dependent sugar dehydrogenase n=1 Tax=Prosthecobacter sp. TaxID=1965333 RepID=UPI0038FF7FB9
MKLRFLLFFALVCDLQAALLHRWSFNAPAGNPAAGTVYADTISGTNVTLRGNGAVLDGSRITLPGNTTSGTAEAGIAAYLNLPNGLISSKTNLTIEIWAAPIAARFFQPLFDFGRMNHAGDGAGAAGEWTGTTGAVPPTSETSDGLALLINRDNNLNTQRQGSRINGGTPLYLDSNLATTAGTTYHYVFTFQDTVSGGTVSWYRNGVLVTSGAVTFHLSDIEDVNNWLGRSQWNVLSNANVAYDEVRIYNHALTPAEVTASQAAGANANFTPPVLQPDSATLHHGQKVRVNVLANDAPGGNAATVEIVQAPQHGTAAPDASGRILYTHMSGTPVSDSFTYRVNSAAGFATPVAVTLTFATSLRIANSTLNVPVTPPTTTYATTPAFGALGFTQPINIATAPGDALRLFVVERPGTIRLIPNVTAGSPTSSTFLNLAALCTSRGETLLTNVDRGLMSMAFHPQHGANGRFFVWYSVQAGGQSYFRISRFNVQGGNPNAADTASELVLIQQLDPNGYHLGTDMHFGTDGYLYISLGDGGGQFDSRRYGQRIDMDFHCALLRIDVDKQPGNPEPNIHASVPRDGGIARYSVPASNPFVTANPNVVFNGVNIPAANVRTEFFSSGLRNPFRFSIDAPTGEIWLGDVGQIQREEINLATNGANFGWSWREGTIAGPNSAEALPGFSYTDPLYEYELGSGEFQGHSITGGFVYRGTSLPDLTGAYVFGDYVDGHIWALRRNGAQVNVQRLTGDAGQVAFGADPSNGDVLMVDINEGRILRLVTGAGSGDYPATLSETGLFADLSDLSPAPGLLPYFVNLPFWSDFALKRRWFIIPDAADMTWSREGAWTYPDGMIWVKHFDLETTRGNPATSQRIETRLLVKNATGSYGVSYRWNAAQTEATLVADAGEEFDINITGVGTQHYRIPSRAECMTCHNPQAGHALSFNTRQMNRSDTIHGQTGNQIDLLRLAGYFTNTPESPNVLPRHVRPDETAFSLESRARSYLAVNCANCHATGSWDGRADRTFAQTGLLNGIATQSGTDPLNRLIVAGDTTHSIVLNRIAVTNGFTRMPPLGSNELDQGGITLMTNWINQLTSRQSYAQWRTAHFGNDLNGAPAVDADGDGRSNEHEFLAGSLPLSNGGPAQPQISVQNGSASLGVSLPANRRFQIETSTNLIDWQLWDVPGNNGLPQPAGTTVFTTPASSGQRFFRVRIEEE